MSDSAAINRDIEVLTNLNADYLASDQNGDVKRYDEILAEDFKASLQDLSFFTKAEFLEMMGKPRPFTDLKADDVQIRVLGDFAIVHAHITWKTLDGRPQQGRYQDDYARRDGRWVCISATVIAQGN